MPAPAVVTLYDFETAYESALANYFSNANTTWQVLTPQTLANFTVGTDILRTPRITCSFSVGSVTDQKNFANGEYYSQRNGSMMVQIVTQRANVSQDYGLMRGTARVAMEPRTAVFNVNTVPWYQTEDVTETGSFQTVSADNDEIMTQLTFAVVFSIPPASFP